MRTRSRWLVFGLALGVPAAAAEPVSFDRDVLPLLEKRCNQCHRPEKQRGGLDLTRIETMRRGGDELGAAIVAGKPDESPLIQVLTGAIEPKMPDKGDPLAAGEIDLLRRWIAEGAKDDSPLFAAEEVAFFEKAIRPVLAARCFKCHAGEEPEHDLSLASRHGILAGGSRGPAAVAGHPEQSLLVKAIRQAGELRMPRNGDRLSEAEVTAFERWIELGLPWPANEKVLARERRFTISDADRDHWAFRPLPKDLPADWNLDAALRTRSEPVGLSPSSESGRYALLRRATYDLIGYPPTSEEIEAFVNDGAEGAFEKVVDRLLASPHFGWRWGRHWLDYTRNGSTGQPTRGPALDADRYALWVARCFNEDRPWDWFARVHLAGDLMPGFTGEDYSIDQALAAAVPLNGPRTFEKAETETFVLMDKLDEGIEFLGRSLLGISLECARCHDHKFDPISQRDYYALLGYFQSSGYAPVPTETATRSEAAAAAEAYRMEVCEKARLHGFIRRQGLLLNVGGGGRVKQWQETRPALLAPMWRRLHELEIEVLRAERHAAETSGSAGLAKDLALAITDREEKLKRSDTPDYDVSAFKEMGYFISGHKSQLGLIKRAEALGREDLAGELKRHADYWEAERQRWGERSTFGGYAKTDPEVAELARASDRIAEIASVLPANPDQPWVTPRPGYLYVRVDGGLRRAEDLAPFDEKAKAEGLQFNSDNANRVFLHPWFIGDSRLLDRGDVLYPDELVTRGTPVFFGESAGTAKGSGRLQLAEWLTAPESVQAALVARTAVNRAWLQLFGEALCRSPKELGRLGESPELPEVLDGLAAEFVREGWSMKRLLRRIVLSEAYRRGTAVEDLVFSKDAPNRLFARQNVRRLDYEAVANTVSWWRTGKRVEGPIRDAEIARHFDAPSPYDLTERRVVSITATQALFMMNHPEAAMG
ncbi:MAG: PSD1 domain-containing protein, partial [Verrucomicrobiae bacterium]|nr:PSD1 domain-containing protein [Verrucomicrobiae bacterium]